MKQIVQQSLKQVISFRPNKVVKVRLFLDLITLNHRQGNCGGGMVIFGQVPVAPNGSCSAHVLEWACNGLLPSCV